MILISKSDPPPAKLTDEGAPLRENLEQEQESDPEAFKNSDHDSIIRNVQFQRVQPFIGAQTAAKRST